MRAQSGLPLGPRRRTASLCRASDRRCALCLSATSSIPRINPRPRARADTGAVGLDRRELRHQRRHFIDDAVAREDSKDLERDGRRPGMTRISKAMAEGTDLLAFVDQRLILARGQPARLLTRPPVGRLAMWPSSPEDPIRLKRPGPREGSRQQQLKLVSNDEPFRFVGGMALLKK
jgi:hypothetical protein